MAKCKIKNNMNGNVYIGISGKRFLLMPYQEIAVEEETVDECTKLLQKDNIVTIEGSSEVAVPQQAKELEQERADELEEDKNENTASEPSDTPEESTEEVPGEAPKEEEPKEEEPKEVVVKEEVKEEPVVKHNKKKRRPKGK